MGGTGKSDASIQAFFPPTPMSSPTKSTTSSLPNSGPPVGDGFTADEVREALKPKPVEPWQPSGEYVECEIRDLYPGPRAVTFMGRIANIFDVANTPKTPRSAKGCVKLCIKDDKGAITVCYAVPQESHHDRLIARAGTPVVCISHADSPARLADIDLDKSQYVPSLL